MCMKNLKIDDATHTRLKVFCAKRKLRINAWVNELIISELNTQDGNQKLSASTNVSDMRQADTL